MNAALFQFVKKSEPGADSPRHQALVRQTEKWVAQSFYGTLLKQMRDDPFRSSLMDGGRGGQAFGELFDERIAERMSHSVAPGLVRAIVKKIEGPRAAAAASYKQQSKSGSTAHPNEKSAAMDQAMLRRLSHQGESAAASFARFNVTSPQ